MNDHENRLLRMGRECDRKTGILRDDAAPSWLRSAVEPADTGEAELRWVACEGGDGEWFVAAWHESVFTYESWSARRDGSVCRTTWLDTCKSFSTPPARLLPADEYVVVEALISRDCGGISASDHADTLTSRMQR